MSSVPTASGAEAPLPAAPAAASPAPAVARRIASAPAAALELHQLCGDWSAGLGKFALQVAFALMAANWAIHDSKHTGILANAWAKWSMTIGFLYLTILLVLIGLHVLLLRRRHAYADSDRARWQREFDAESSNVGTAWPYTDGIERNGTLMFWLHLLAPLAMGCLLVVSVFAGTPRQTKVDVATPVAAATASSSAAPSSGAQPKP